MKSWIQENKNTYIKTQLKTRISQMMKKPETRNDKLKLAELEQLIDQYKKLTPRDKLICLIEKEVKTWGR